MSEHYIQNNVISLILRASDKIERDVELIRERVARLDDVLMEIKDLIDEERAHIDSENLKGILAQYFEES